MDPQRERQLVRAAKKDPQAFAALYDAYVDKVLSYTYRLLGALDDAEEATAETFHKALRGLARFRWNGRGVLPWLYRIAGHEAVNLQRAKRRRREVLFWDPPPEVTQEALQEESEGDRRRLGQALARALAALEAKDRQIVALHYLQGEPYAVVAEVVGMKEGATRVRAQRALQKLQRVLESEGWTHEHIGEIGWDVECENAEVSSLPASEAGG